ncbi:MAG TPA: Ig-like domain repeat protein [Candidatus Acidoferrales bacterium]
MQIQRSAMSRLFVLFAFLFLSAAAAFAQAPEVRITQAIDEANLVTLKGNVHAMARPEFDRGIAPASLPMDRMTLVLRRSAGQEAALAALLDEQQDQSSPNYHQWLTPAQFGEKFGASAQDIETITSWLQSRGFQVNHVSNGRMQIEFSGTAGQVQQAFHTAIHRYAVPSAAGTGSTTDDHWANATDPEIPAALAPAVAGIATLHNFLKASQHILSSEKFPFERKPGKSPEFTGVSGGQAVHAVGPGDLAVIYNATPLYAASPAINGTGSTVAVVARSNINVDDLDDFKNMFGLEGPTIQILVNGSDPGDLGGNEELEAVLDASYSSALAQQAQVNFVVSASTNTADGVDLSELHIIDNNLGDVMTESFGGCELGVTSGEATNISNLAQQAAAQGISYLVSTGDNGSAGCDNPSSSLATHGVSVNVLASSPYTIGVGGTMFNEGALSTSYWNTTNGNGLVSAKSYIPESVWNQSCSVSACGSSDANLVAGSGGLSTIFTQPAWQSGVAGIPAPPAGRSLPDVSLTAAGHDPYLICIEGGCGNGILNGVEGTSASVQAFGGIMALVRQKVGARVGQADYVFYKLASKETLASCNGSAATPVPAANCIFYDTTVGNNAVPGITSGQYAATVGYDSASGLGSVNITNLVNQWSAAVFNPSATTLSITPTNFTHGASATFNITVAPKTGTPSFNNEQASLLSSTGAAVTDVLLSSTGTASGVTNTIPGGSTTLTAHYPGNGVLGASDSSPVALTVVAEPSTTTLSVVDQSGNSYAGGVFGTLVNVNAVVAGQSGFGTPSGSVTFSNNGATLSQVPTGTGGEASLTSEFAVSQVGVYSIVAKYAGDPSFESNTSSTINYTITKATPTVSLSSNEPEVQASSGVLLTATVQTNSQAGAADGNLTFFDGSNALGMLPVQQGEAFFTTGALALGMHTFTVQYPGNSNFNAVTSAAVTVNVVNSADFTISVSPGTVNVGSPGQSGTGMLTVTGINGFDTATTFTCSGLPAKSACTFTPPSVTGSGTTAFMVATTASTLALPLSTRHDPSGLVGSTLRAATLSFVLFVLVLQLRRRERNVAASVLAVVVLAALAACGGGGGGGSPTISGTPVGATTITVTASTSTGLSHTTTFLLNVE